jgi:hypothetical protein
MSFSGRLIHSLTITTPTTEVGGELDDYGQPEEGEPTVVTCQGLVQPKNAREIAQSNQAGAVIADYTIFLERQEVSTAAYIEWDGARFEVMAVRDFNFGTAPHLEVDCRRVAASAEAAS